MKIILFRALFFLFIISFLIQACTKETTQSTKIVSASTQQNSTTKGVSTLVLQPGPQDGYDTWLTWKRNDPVITNWNWDTVAITAAYAWTSSGIPITGRSLVAFKGLSAIPARATIISARLYMYGVESSPHLPAGNSVYKGSPYHDDNSMTVLRVTQSWDSKTVT